MERSEAIEILKGIPNHIGDDCDGYELKAIRLAIEALEKQIEYDFWNNNEVSKARGKAIEAIAQPEIIYCKDCKHNHKNWDVWGNNFCFKTEQCSDDENFCCWAERIEDGTK